MTNKKRILVAVDGSEQSNDAFQEALRLGTLEPVEFIFLSVIVEIMPNNDELYLSLNVRPEMDDVYRALAEKRLEEMTAGLGSDVSYKNEAVHGDAKRSIVSYAKDNNVDLIVIGATGRGALERSLIGSTTAYVVNHAPCNVLVVK
ncbi:universal stress protein [Listeria booriae]|uniref:universal stress protein n=1 Tax=Listeria booriae TaxID=1552123 RepID=UPI001626F891|nr:universal stress protein [Listeria booriae]MBC1211068.1 universal stress protein [Listeria booriae]MBC1226914.1 universal stress protein [Listeria booriae]